MSKINKVVVKGVSYDIEDAYAVRENNLNNLKKELIARIQGKSESNNPLDDIVYLGNFVSYYDLIHKLATLYSDDPGEAWDYCGLFTATIQTSSRVFIMNSCTSFEDGIWQQSIIGNVQVVETQDELGFYSHGMNIVHRYIKNGSWSKWSNINNGIKTITITPNDNSVKLETETEHGDIDYYRIPSATEKTAGVMSAEDKKALDDVPKNIAKEKTAIVNGDTIAGLAREVYSRTGKVDTATFLKRTTAGGTTISDGVASIKEIGGNIVKNNAGRFYAIPDSNATLTNLANGIYMYYKNKNVQTYLTHEVDGFVDNHVYYVWYYNYTNTSIVPSVALAYGYTPGRFFNFKKTSVNSWELLSKQMKFVKGDTAIGKSTWWPLGTGAGNVGDYCYFTASTYIDLTEMFGAGKEPTKEECDRLFGNMDALPQGLTIAQPTGLKSVGYNQWNPVNVLRNKSIVENSIEDDVENSHIAVVECLPCKIGDGENNGYVVGYGEGEQWDEDGIEVYFSPLNPMDYIDQDVDLYMHKLEQDATYGTYVPQCKGYLLVVTPTTDKLCVNFHWSGDRSKLDYEEYTESNVALPEIPQMSEWGLAGIQSSGTLVADTIDLDRMVYTKSIGAVDLGSLNWSKYLDKFFSASLIGAKDNTTLYAYSNCTTSKYSNATPSEIYNLTQTGISLGSAGVLTNGRVLINDQTYTDAASLKSSLQGVMLYYELAEPEEYPIVTKASPNYIGSDYGVEEFIGSKIPLNANILFYMRSLVGETRNFLDRLYDNTDKTDAKEVADYITNGIEGNKELATNAPNLALRALFIAAGAEYNDTDSHIVKNAPWNAYVDSVDYKAQWNLDVVNGSVQTLTHGGNTYEYVDDNGTWKIIARVGDKLIWDDTKVIHRKGYYYLNGLGDITEEQMMKIYDYTFPLTGASDWSSALRRNTSVDNTVRTNILKKDFYANNKIKVLAAAFYNSFVEVVRFTGSNDVNWGASVGANASTSTMSETFQNATKLRYVIGVIDLKTQKTDSVYFGTNAPNINIIMVKNLVGNFRLFDKSKVISKKSVLYIIQNATPTSAITITLHADAFARLKDDADIVAALAAQPLITLVSA